MPIKILKGWKFSKDTMYITRKTLSLSQSLLAQKVGVSYVTISNWERGTCEPAAKYISKLSKVLKINPNNLFIKNPKLNVNGILG